MIRRLAVGAGLALLVLLAGCKPPLAPVRPDQTFVLAPRDRAFVEEANFRLELLEVTGDSRCPIDAICVWAGDATVHVKVSDVRTDVRYELHAGDATRAAVAHQGFVIRLVELQPYPSSTRPIAPAEYRATFRVTR